jgi:hypothetical protein
MGKVTNPPLPWLGFDEDRSWVPLYQAPFVYRIRSGEDWDEPWDSAALGRELVSRLHHLGVHDAIIDPPTGMVTLILSKGVKRPSKAPIRFHLTECNPDEIPDDRLWEAVSQWVAFIVSRLKIWLKRAVEQRRCVIVARTEIPLSGFRRIPLDAFLYFDVIDLKRGKAKSAEGVMLFSIRVAPPDFGHSVRSGGGAQMHPSSMSRTERLCEFLPREFPTGKPPNVSYLAIAAEFTRQTGLHVSDAWVRLVAQNRLGWTQESKRAKKA